MVLFVITIIVNVIARGSRVDRMIRQQDMIGRARHVAWGPASPADRRAARERRLWRNRSMTFLIGASVVLTLIPVVWILVQIVLKGGSAMSLDLPDRVHAVQHDEAGRRLSQRAARHRHHGRARERRLDPARHTGRRLPGRIRQGQLAGQAHPLLLRRDDRRALDLRRASSSTPPSWSSSATEPSWERRRSP